MQVYDENKPQTIFYNRGHNQLKSIIYFFYCDNKIEDVKKIKYLKYKCVFII